MDNPFKTGSSLPDAAELHALLRAQDLLQQMRGITPHPVRFHYIWDGGINAPFAGVSLDHADACLEKLNAYVVRLNDPRIELHDYRDLIAAAGLNIHDAIKLDDVPLDSEDFRKAQIVGSSYWASFLQTHRPLDSHQTLVERVGWYKRMACLRNTDSEVLRPLMRKFLQYSRLTQFLRNEKLADKAFSSQTIRFSANPRTGALGLGLNGKLRRLLPHHGIAVFSQKRRAIRHMVEVICSDEFSDHQAVVDKKSRRILSFTKS